jgi:D-hexose-6-phosphate mutarotase
MKVEFTLSKKEAEEIFTRAFHEHFKVMDLRVTKVDWSEYRDRVEVYATNAPVVVDAEEEAA